MSAPRHLRVVDQTPIETVDVDASAMARLVEMLGTPEFYGALRSFINGMVAVDNCVALVFDRNGPPTILHQWSPQQPNYFQMLYAQGAYTLDPFYRASLDERRHCIMMLHDIAPDGFGESDFYKAYYEKVEMIDEIGLLCPVDDNHTIHLSLGRRSKSSHFAVTELERIKALQPLLDSLLLKQFATAGLHVPFVGSKALEPVPHWLAAFHITTREAEIADMVLRGHSNVSIGLLLDISAETVKVHRRNLYGKLRISSQAELFNLFISHILPQARGTA